MRAWVREGLLFRPDVPTIMPGRVVYRDQHPVLDPFLLWLRSSNSRAARLLRDEAGAAGDVKSAYAASANEGTLTALNSLASSQTWVAGWESSLIDNTTNLYTDYRLTAKLTVASSANQAGELRMYCVGMLDDSTWPDVFDGTVSAETVTSAEIRDAICKPASFSVTTNTAGRVYYLDCPSVARVFDYCLPKKFVVFITINPTTTTTAGLAASGNQLTVVGTYGNVAQS